jgi:hypothetical protein
MELPDRPDGGSRPAAATGTRTRGRDRPTARTGTGYRRHHGAPGGHAHGPRGPSDDDLAFVARLAQGLERGARELGQLLEEQHAAMRERSGMFPEGAAWLWTPRFRAFRATGLHDRLARQAGGAGVRP